MAEIVLEHLSKTYPGGVVAVDDVSLRIGDGEFIVLVGPSGCGKSTLLRLIAGLEEVSQGAISIDGTEVTTLARQRDGLPELRALSAHERAPEHRLRPEGSAHAEGRGEAPRRRGREAARAREAPRPQAGTAVGRAAAARRNGARD